MRILVTGAAGFIGSHLCERLLGRGDEVVGLDSFDETLYPAAIKRRNLAGLAGFSAEAGLPGLAGSSDKIAFSGSSSIPSAPIFSSPAPSEAPRGLRLVEGDLLDAPLVDELVGARPDVVVHLAALAGVRPSIQQPKRYQRTNIEGTLNVLEAMRAHGLGRLVFASSSSVYGARPAAGEGGFHEDDPSVRPASPYAATKRAGELLCSNYADLHGIATASLRFFTVYGPRQRPEMAVHKFARLIDEGRPLPLFGDGTTARDYTFIDDIIDGVVAAIDAVGTPRLPERFRIYNLGGHRTTTLARLVTLLEEALGRPALVERLPDQPGDVPLTWADVTRAGAELGYAPRVPIEEGIRRFVEWFRSEPR